MIISILISIICALILLAAIQQNKLEKLKEENESQKTKVKTDNFIKQKETESKHAKDSLSEHSDDYIDGMLNDLGILKDRSDRG